MSELIDTETHSFTILNKDGEEVTSKIAMTRTPDSKEVVELKERIVELTKDNTDLHAEIVEQKKLTTEYINKHALEAYNNVKLQRELAKYQQLSIEYSNISTDYNSDISDLTAQIEELKRELADTKRDLTKTLEITQKYKQVDDDKSRVYNQCITALTDKLVEAKKDKEMLLANNESLMARIRKLEYVPIQTKMPYDD